MNKLMSAPRDPPEWGVGVICVRCLIAAYPMFNGQCSMFNVQCSMFNDQNGCKGTLIKRLDQKIMLKNVRGGVNY